jgi:hypothetical protein
MLSYGIFFIKMQILYNSFNIFALINSILLSILQIIIIITILYNVENIDKIILSIINTYNKTYTTIGDNFTFSIKQYIYDYLING